MFPKDTRILVVDDLKTIRILLTEMLNNLGYRHVEDAASGGDALGQLQDAVKSGQPFGLIIADWNMPGMTGIDLLEARNKDDNLSSTPFLMVTIESEREHVLKAVALGVSDFIVKPFSEKTIEAKMKSIWERLHEQ